MNCALNVASIHSILKDESMKSRPATNAPPRISFMVLFHQGLYFRWNLNSNSTLASVTCDRTRKQAETQTYLIYATLLQSLVATNTMTPT